MFLCFGGSQSCRRNNEQKMIRRPTLCESYDFALCCAPNKKSSGEVRSESTFIAMISVSWLRKMRESFFHISLEQNLSSRINHFPERNKAAEEAFPFFKWWEIENACLPSSSSLLSFRGWMNERKLAKKERKLKSFFVLFLVLCLKNNRSIIIIN